MKIGAHCIGNGQYKFSVWVSLLSMVSLKIVSPYEKIFPMERDDSGYWKTTIKDQPQNILYYYRHDEKDRPDPASHFQPKGVHGPSQVVNHSFNWQDAHWKGIDPAEMIIYEIHVGTFTPNETFDAIIHRLDELKDLGINSSEIMPITQFPDEDKRSCL